MNYDFSTTTKTRQKSKAFFYHREKRGEVSGEMFFVSFFFFLDLMTVFFSIMIVNNKTKS